MPVQRPFARAFALLAGLAFILTASHAALGQDVGAPPVHLPVVTGGSASPEPEVIESNIGPSTMLVALDSTALPLASVQAISSGGHHSCALTATGGVKCWGQNSYGQLGDGSPFIHSVAMDVSGLTSGVTAVTTGYSHSCALTDAGGVKCWGHNSFGQLGNGTLTTTYSATDVIGLASGVSAISAGGWHTCALTTAGAVKCWGRNFYGGLGDGSTTTRTTPVDVVGLAGGVRAISSGQYHTCALTETGGVKCWGWNSNGQLGTGDWPDSSVPVDVSGLISGVVEVAAGDYHTCALTGAGGVKCWGSNQAGQLGDGLVRGDYRTPVDVNGLGTGVGAISGRGTHNRPVAT